MKTRRHFLKVTSQSSLAFLSLLYPLSSYGRNTLPSRSKNQESSKGYKPIVISTWDHGMVSNATSWKILASKGTALDAVEQGVRVVESDPKGQSVGLGGLPDREGFVTLDACIMNHKNECGAVGFLQNIENPISVARKVMEETPHVFLVGKGAYDFALSKGFKQKKLLTEKSEQDWKQWLKKSHYQPIINSENHDTIGSLALDSYGNLSGACTTSGMAYKYHGRLGDSPIIGAGLFVDNEVGAACATGVGEAVIRIAGSAIIVELMRQGKTPQEACEEAILRIIHKHKNIDNLQVGFLALNKNGEYGSFSVYDGFTYALTHSKGHQLLPSKYKIKQS